MPKFNDLSGKKIGRLSVISLEPKDKGPSFWKCLCDCGNVIIVKHGSLQSGNTKSCGCLQLDAIRKTSTKHGYSKSLTHRIWCGIMTRCFNQNHGSFKLYGERGISVSTRWLSFENFLHDMGPCPEGFSIDRIDTNGNYELENCRWADQKTQTRNQRTNVLLTFNNKTKCMTDWAVETGIKRETIARRIKLGWPVEKILTAPVRLQSPKIAVE